MKYLLLFALFINIITILLFSGLYFISRKDDVLPKQKALWSSFSGAGLFLYLVSFGILTFEGIIKQNPLMFSLALFFFIPFVIGKKASYETLKKYLILQIFVFVLSLLVLFILINK